MNLFSTVRNFRRVGDTGIWEGDLRLFFSTEAEGDLSTAPVAGIWTSVTSQQTIQSPTGEVLTTTFRLLNDDVPSVLYLFPSIEVTDGGQQIFDPHGTGAPTAGFVPGTPALTKWSGKNLHINDKFVGEAGFEMIVPFDGVSADCYGKWWAIWSPAP
jgi:hypothetical protein